MAKGETKTEPREYVVLARADDGSWKYAGLWTATSAQRAIDDAREGVGGRWVAVPLRNWNEENLDIVQREPTVKRTKVVPGQTTLPVEEPVAA